jgi:hypothetical protein
LVFLPFLQQNKGQRPGYLMVWLFFFFIQFHLCTGTGTFLLSCVPVSFLSIVFVSTLTSGKGKWVEVEFELEWDEHSLVFLCSLECVTCMPIAAASVCPTKHWRKLAEGTEEGKVQWWACLERNEEKIVGMMSGEASEKTDKWMDSHSSSQSKWSANASFKWQTCCPSHIASNKICCYLLLGLLYLIVCGWIQLTMQYLHDSIGKAIVEIEWIDQLFNNN